MRPTGILAGIEFMNPPMWHRDWDKWREIISESGYFFTKSAKNYFDSRVNWDSLCGITQELYGFITSERSDMGAWNGERRYTVRLWDIENGVFSGSEFGQFATLKEAKHWLGNNGFGHLPRVIAHRERAKAQYEAWRAEHD